MRSSLVVRASGCQCTNCNGPGFDPSIRRHSGIWGAADEAVLNTVRKKRKNPPPPKKKKYIYLDQGFGSSYESLCYRTVAINYWHRTTVADPDPDALGSVHHLGSRIRICFKDKTWIWLRIKVKIQELRRRTMKLWRNADANGVAVPQNRALEPSGPRFASPW